MTAEFVVTGVPVGKGRPQFSTHNGHIHVRTPQKTVVYENLVRLEYKQQCKNIRFANNIALSVEIRAYYSIPASKSKKTKEAMSNGIIRPTKKPDCDNVIKSILDALNNVAYYDDSQVVDCQVKKFYDERPRVEVKITELEKEI